MDFKEVIPITALRIFDAMCLHNNKLQQDKALQQQILNWAADMMTEAREYWSKLQATTIEAVIKTHHREKAHKGAVVRDKNMPNSERILQKFKRKNMNFLCRTVVN